MQILTDEEYQKEVLEKQRYEGKNLLKEDFEIMIYALQKHRAQELYKKDHAVSQDHEAQRNLHQGRVNRCTLLIEMCQNEIKRIMKKRFERKRKSKKWDRAMLYNTNKYCN